MPALSAEASQASISGVSASRAHWAISAAFDGATVKGPQLLKSCTFTILSRINFFAVSAFGNVIFNFPPYYYSTDCFSFWSPPVGIEPINFLSIYFNEEMRAERIYEPEQPGSPRQAKD
jgi:hypothetical protein